MAAGRPPELIRAGSGPAFRISAGDSVTLSVLRRPDELCDASVVFEVWQPGGSQPPNSHPGSVETFFFLRGEGLAYCDDHEVPVRAGELLVLPPGSVHRIVNTGPGRLYAITTMTPDAGFADLIEAGVPAELDPEDRAVAAGGGTAPGA